MAAENPDTILGPHPTKKQKKEHRTELTTAGTKGGDLRRAMREWRKGEKEKYNADLLGRLPEDFQPYIQHPEKFTKGFSHRLKQLMKLRQTSDILGYGKNKEKLDTEYGRQFDALAGEDPGQAGSKIEVERDFQESPTLSAFQGYVGRHINPDTGEAAGLTPGEENAIRGAGMHAIGTATTGAYRNQGERLNAAGIDPRSGLAAGQGQEIEAERLNNMANLERGIVDTNLQRKQQFEGYASDLGRTEEQRRQFDVSGDLRRLADVEAGQGNLAQLSENQRQYDITHTESRRQARLAREAAKKAAQDLEPSTLDKVGAGFQGFFGGLGMGGGGGGGGGGMMGGMGK